MKPTTIDIAQVNRWTGEVLEGATLAIHYPKARNGFQKEGFMTQSLGASRSAAKLNLGGEAYRVLFYAISTLDYENLLVLSQTDAARELNMKQQSVHRAMDQLIGAEIILKGPKVSGRNTYRLNPNFGWRGSAKNHRQELANRVKAAGLTVIDGQK